MIHTANLSLLPSDLRHLEAMARNDGSLAGLIGVSVPEAYPVERDALPWFCKMMQDDPGLVGWLHFMVILTSEKVLIGDVGFKGKPDDSGTIEVGYSLISEYRGRGLATEAVDGLIRHVWERPDVQTIRAHTRIDNPKSERVLIKLGFSRVKQVSDPEEGEMWLWNLRR